MTSGRPEPRRSTPIAASLPPAGLPGLDPAWSRLVDVPERAVGSVPGDAAAASVGAASAGRTNRWHILDNAAALDALGVTPVGTILCVHGNPTWSYLWRETVAAATDAAAAGRPAWRVIAVDQLEMGHSERSGVARPLARRVQDLSDLTRELGVTGPVVTFGHDWGGVISLGWAVDHPDQLVGVMLLNTAVHQPEDTPIPAALRLALTVLRTGTVTTTAFLDTTLAIAHPQLPSEVRRAYRSPYLDAARREGIGAFVADIPVDASHESAAELARISAGVARLTVPALMMWGPRDPVFSDRYLDDLQRRMPHADVHRFETAGHLIAEDVDYAGPALDWLADNLGGTPGATRQAAEAEAEPQVPAAATEPALPMWHHLESLAHSSEPAVVDMVAGPGRTPRTVSWALLSTRVHQIARGLVALGVKSGDRVSLLVPPSADLTAVVYACLRIGAVVVVADAGLGLRGLSRAVRGARPDHIIGEVPGLTVARAFGWPGQRISVATLPAVSARALNVTASLAGVIRAGEAAHDLELPHPPAASDVAAVLFTSGSTGPAKGVVYTHGQLMALRDALSAQYDVGVGTGLVAGFAPFALLGPALGARSVTPDMDVTSPRTLTARAVADAAAEVDATVVFLSPAAIANVVATAGELSSAQRAALARVRTFLSAGAPVSEALLTAASELMPAASAHTPYGMTEGLLMADISLDGIRSSMASQATPGAPDAAAGGVPVGRPTATTRIRIAPLDAAGVVGAELTDATGVTGEIVVSAPHLKSHYDRLWITNRVADAHSTPGERWHHTGDVGHLDAEGRLWVEGRLQHVIVTAEGVVTPVGIEQAVERVDGVRRAAVVGVGPRGAAQLVVVLELEQRQRRSRLAEPELAAAVREAAAAGGHEVAAVLVADTLPTDIRHNSKIDRTALARWADGILRGGRMVSP
ncbi:alpha/beta fold hydrolase [Leifsonia sp. Leaf264]|uniref:alpha/beta fold hydrolase n=1 Tax=Leifsonia sp. Leaf264 TaxID=1736314 RepID=UPI0006F4ED7A|nr:alpha/beta fold hydrolase [Leifsonia sp. Leaf264]KQO99703.1 hydrolase [Leifsonia sp. Leaf264]